ncbi:hypothetical protein [Pseudofrankia asymbiotica]|uniref:Helix-turn-helix domain-containing protein n=1 Tax=Pseudofrankia asymbiotica TaxID=1834516 RepID=A0A1V2I3Y8_9ACTN|nr:hypothetical protein [Pseudofrankia asymbiotica]ONH25236.1 hypothetical protein BL253_28115 [Pseudofrankia asymbiotica]
MKAESRRAALTREELLALPAVIDLQTAARAFGMGRTKAYDLARAGEFPCRVLRINNIYHVPTAELLRVLGVSEDSTDPVDDGPER